MTALMNSHDFKKARVILLNPPTACESTEPLLGIAYIASMLRKHGHEVKLIDATAPYKRLTAQEVERIIKDFSPHYIGVTLTIDYIPQTYEYIKGLHKIGIPIVAGGSHVNPLPHEALNNGTDIVVLGEGEITAVELADYFAGNNMRIEDIKGICFKKENGDIFKTQSRPLIQNLDDIPFPSFLDFPIKNYTGVDNPDSNPIFWSIFSSRGCPYNCTFCCGHNVFGRTYRFRSAQNIFSEMMFLANEYGARTFAFQDDEVMLNRERMIELCSLILKSKLKIKISVRSRIDSLDTELLKICKEAGFHRITFGIESWNDKTLDKIKKHYQVKDIEHGLNILDEAGYLNVNFNNIIGLPWETREHYKKNLEVIKKIPEKIKYYTGTTTPIPYPNTELYDEYHEKYGFTDWWLKPDKHWPHYRLFSTGKYRPVFFRLARRLGPLFTQDLYWKYTKQQKTDIEYFCWKSLDLFLRRRLGIVSGKMTLILCKVSHLLWSISPKLEKFMFRYLMTGLISKIEYKLSFVHACE